MLKSPFSEWTSAIPTFPCGPMATATPFSVTPLWDYAESSSLKSVPSGNKLLRDHRPGPSVCLQQTLERQSVRPGLSSASNNQALERQSARTFCLPPSVCNSQLKNSREFELFTEQILTFLLLSYQQTTRSSAYHSDGQLSSADRSVETCIPRIPVWSSFDCTHCHFRGRHTKCFVPLGQSHFIVRKFAYLSSRASQRRHLQSASWGACLLVNSGLRKVTQVEW